MYFNSFADCRRIREMSDLHLEFGPLDVPVLPDEDKMVLILSGDIGVVEKIAVLIAFLVAMSKRHYKVFIILGNHEHYGGSLQRSYDKIKDALPKECTNVHVLERECVVVDGVAFIGATLWTDCNKGDPITLYTLEKGMNDYRTIRNGPKSHPYAKKLQAIDTAIIHGNTIDWLFPEIDKQKAAGNKVVVFTHHAPSTMSIHPIYKTDYHFNGGYASALENRILDTNPDLWFHGHTHTNFDYMVGDTRIVCNPRGYAGHELNPDFDPELVIEV
jgi:2',3'-cyclic-nucleotide 2'-phosphodiesterase (5'-nucleotidase family)